MDGNDIYRGRFLTLARYSIRNVLSTYGYTFRHMSKQGEEKAALSYLVPKRLKEELQALADADRRKLGPYIQLVLEAHVEAKRAERKPRGKR